MDKPRKLNDRHWLFVKHFCLTGSRIEAMHVAGYNGTDKVKSVMASQILARPDVKAAIEEYRKVMPEPMEIVEAAVEEPGSLGVLHSREARATFLAQVATATIENGERLTWKDRLHAFDMLAKMMGDYLIRPKAAGDTNVQNTQTNVIIGDPEAAKALLRGEKTPEDVINVEARALGDGSGRGRDEFALLVEEGAEDGAGSADEGVGDGP